MIDYPLVHYYDGVINIYHINIVFGWNIALV